MEPQVGVHQIGSGPAGPHTLTISAPPDNCTVANGLARPVTVPAGGSATLRYDITCALGLPGRLVLLPRVPLGTPYEPKTIEVDGATGTIAGPVLWPYVHSGPIRLAPDGQRVTYPKVIPGERDTRIVVSMRDGSGASVVTAGPADADPTWSPDGQRIAFTRRIDDNTRELWVMDADGANAQAIYAVAGDRAAAPAWSPDGTRILLSLFRAGTGRTSIVTIGPAGAGLTFVANAPTASVRNQHPRWSPDGARFLFVQEGGTPGPAGATLWVANADGSVASHLIQPPNIAGYPTWSPDGAWILFGIRDPEGTAFTFRVVRPDNTAWYDLEFLPEVYGTTIEWWP